MPDYKDMFHRLLALVHKAHPTVINQLPYEMQEEWKKSLYNRENRNG